MSILYFLGFIVLGVWISNLRKRVETLEKTVGQNPAGVPTPAVTPASGVPSPTPFAPSGIPPLHPLPVNASGADASDRFLEWLKEDWLLKLGAFLLLIGFGWFASYAFLHNWIGPFGRITLGILAGTGIMTLGWWRMQKEEHQGGVFLVLGSTVVLLTLFAGRTLYDFFTPLSALVTMFLSTAFVALASVKYNNRALALASLALAGVAPLLTNSPHPDYIGLFTYLLVVVLGTVWVTVLTNRRELVGAALIMISLYSLPHISSGYLADRGALLLFAYAFAGIFFITNSLGLLRLRGKDMNTDLLTAAGNGLFLLVWIVAAVPKVWQSLTMSAWMVVFAVGAFVLFRATGKREPFYVYAGVGIAMLAAATAAELDGAALTIAYIAESALVSLVAYGLLRDVRIAERLSLLLIGPAVLTSVSIVSPAWKTGVLHQDFFVLLLMTLALFGLGFVFMQDPQNADEKAEVGPHTTLLVFGSVYAYVLIWLTLHASLQNDDTAVMFSLLVYTVIGITTYLQGMALGKKGLRIYGTALLMCVVARLLLVDVWNMELTGRIVTFFLIGGLLMSTAFMGKKSKEGVTHTSV